MQIPRDSLSTSGAVEAALYQTPKRILMKMLLEPCLKNENILGKRTHQRFNILQHFQHQLKT